MTQRGKVHIGTCGYSYDEWRGVLYGPDTPRGDFLTVYAQRFTACELDYTFYRVPTARAMWIAAQNSLRRVVFTVKVPGLVTHERRDVEKSCSDLLRAVEPLRELGLLGALLAQFPYSFKNNSESWRYIAHIAGLLAGPQLVVEFRHASFAEDGTFERLLGLGLAFCCVDGPRLRGLMPPLMRVTAPVAYLRLHGRNAAHWWAGDRATRYSYLYSREELKDLTKAIAELRQSADTTFVFFNNHHMGQAVVNALEMQELLGHDD